jgi:two-component system CheB/CheR fusion protein
MLPHQAAKDGANSVPSLQAVSDNRIEQNIADAAQADMILNMLHTVNTLLARTLADLEVARNDLQNLLEITQVAAVFVDENLNIRRFTPPLVRLYRISAADIGKPLSRMPAVLDYPDLESDFRNVSKTEALLERQVGSADGRSRYVMRMRPYHQGDGSIDGAAIVFAKLPDTEAVGSPRA